MASPLADADAVKSAVSSISTCSAATIVTLKTLLLPNLETSSSKPTKQTTTAAGKAPRRTKTTKDDGKDELPVKEKAALATQVLNAALKSLTEAAKPAPQIVSRKECQDDLVKTVTRRALRRSNSAPLSPLQARSLNRVMTSPVRTARPHGVSAFSNISASCLPTIECARIAFLALKTLQASGKIKLPELQLEAGMSSLAGKLISLGLYEHAVKELRILKRRLEEATGHDTKNQTKSAAAENKGMATVLAELLDFAGIKASDTAMTLVVTTQVQVLRIMSAMKKPQHIEAALPVLRKSHPSSVLNHILSMVKSPKSDTGKLARQMETVSQILLSLAPSVSSKDDAIATDSRLNVLPTAAFELQALGLEARLLWWKLAGHQGESDTDVLSPLSRCLVAVLRRVNDKQSVYGLCKSSVARVFDLLRSLSKQPSPPSTSSKSPQSTIYQALTTLADECGKLEDALYWAQKLRTTLDQNTESPTKICSVSAQLLAIQLKQDPSKYLVDESLLDQVMSGVQGSLRGDTSELDELLASVSNLRRPVMAILLGHVEDISLSRSTKESLEAFVLQCPRFCIRWLGKPPTPTSSTKDYLRYEQRRHLLLQSLRNTLDCALSLAKTRLEEKRLEWDALETILAECLILLNSMGEVPSNGLHHVKISSFYYMMYNSLWQKQGNESAALKALRRSIDCIKDRPTQEKEKGQLLVKLERMFEFCKRLGRGDEALGALQDMRNSLMDDGVLETVAIALGTRHPQVAWSLNYKASLLNRTLSSIARMEMVHMDWTSDFSEAQQAAVLEHRLHFVLLGGEKRTQGLTLEEPTVDALLRIYIPTRFPIRRLRTLLRLLCATLGNQELISGIRSIAADAVQLDEEALGEDGPLAQYLPHMRALFASVTGLIDGFPDLQSLQQTLSIWRTMVDPHPTREELEARVDGIEDFLVHLESVADLMRLRGHQSLLNTVIRLAADISRIVEGPRTENLVNSHLSLALHLTDSGLSTQAGQIFEAAEAFVAKHGDTPGHVAAELQLALADHLMTIGNPGKA
jgi:separase